MTDPSVVVLHDEFSSVGGAEQVAVQMATILDTHVYTSKKETTHFDREVEIIPLGAPEIGNPIIDEVLSGIPFYRLDVPEAEVIVSTGDRSKLFVPEAHQTVINYTHTPTRWVYDLREQTAADLGFVKGLGLRTIAMVWGRVLERALKNVDVFLCNSPVIQDRMRRYWGVEAEVLYPPVDTSRFYSGPDEGYYLWINRLLPRKRPGTVFEAFASLDVPLRVIGDGLDRFEKQARETPNVEYLGRVSEERKLDLLAHCRGVVYVPVNEDFGIVPIEAFSSGKPVIGVREGFTKYQIENGKNGVFAEPTPEGIRRAVRSVNETDWNGEEIQRYSERYDVVNFASSLSKVVVEAIN